MGYTILIGNAELESDFDADDRPHAEWVVGRTTHPDAPLMPDENARSNDRSPGYGVWSDFLKDVRLHSMFFARATTGDGLMDNHPGIARLTADHAAKVMAALAAYREAHPDRVPGICDCRECQGPFGPTDAPAIPHDPRADFVFLRLEWLSFWVSWAVANCERPAIHNY